jgi:hypothetical protein
MQKTILFIAFAQTSPSRVAVPTSISPNAPMYPAPLTDYSNPSVYLPIRR